MEGEMSTKAFVFQIEFECRDCGKVDEKIMRLRPFEYREEKYIGCRDCRDKYGDDHHPLMMYFYENVDSYDDDLNICVKVKVQRVE
jgi:hypothetical protein